MLLQIIRIKNGYNWILFQILPCNGVLQPDWAWVGAGGPAVRGKASRAVFLYAGDQTPSADPCELSHCVSCPEKASVTYGVFRLGRPRQSGADEPRRSSPKNVRKQTFFLPN